MIFEDIRAFVAVAESKSFLSASVYLCTAQSALSKRVQRLETRVGVPLLQRHARGVLLTEHGHVFLERVKPLVQDLQDLEKNLASTVNSPVGTVNLALPQRTAGLLAPEVINKCRQAYSQIKINILEGTPSTVHEWISSGEADIGVTYSYDLIENSRYKLILNEPLYLFIHKDLYQAIFPEQPASLKISDLEKVSLILPKRPNPLRVMVDKVASSRGIKVKEIYECDGTSATRGMIEKGLGATLFGVNSTWKHLVHDGHVVARPFDSPMVSWRMYLVNAKERMDSMAVEKVYEIIEPEIHALMQSGQWKNAGLHPIER